MAAILDAVTRAPLTATREITAGASLFPGDKDRSVMQRPRLRPAC
jgi:hypothetical protein